MSEESVRGLATSTQEEMDVREPQGAIALALSVIGVVLAAVTIIVFLHGQRPMVALPGPMPPLDQLPDIPEARQMMRWMRVAMVLGLVSLTCEVVGGLLGWRSHLAGDTRGTWAMITALCWPMLVVLTLGGIAAS